jgi:hypothetical protein
MNLEPVEKILKERFLIELSTSDLEVIADSNWDKFAKKRGLSKDGVFLPRSMKAYVRDNENVEQNILHEHIGHRVYFERTQAGIHIVSLEKDLKRIEDLILTGFDMEPDSQLEFHVHQHPETCVNITDVVQVGYNIQTPLANAHHTLANTLMKAHGTILNHAEAFADWISQHLAQEIGLPYTPQSSLEYHELKNIEKKQGPFTAYFHQQTSKVYDDDMLMRLLSENFKDDLDTVEYIIKFGSDNPSSDIDFLFVSENPDFLKSFSVPTYLDISFVSPSEFVEALQQRDIQYTTPVINGRFLRGDKNSITPYLNNENRKDAQKRAEKQEKKALDYATECLSLATSQHDPLMKLNNACRALINITYARTYHQLTKNNDGIPDHDTFLEFKDKDPLMRDARDYAKKLKEQPGLLDLKKISHYLSKALT